MGFLKEKKGIIISFIIGVIVASSITVYATSYFAKDVTYKDGKNVEEALNELYSKINASNVEAYSSGSVSKVGAGTFWSKQLTVSQNVREVTVYLDIVSPYGSTTPTISGDIIESSDVTSLGSGYQSGLYSSTFYKIEIRTNQKDGTITINANVGGNQYSYNHTASMVVVYN